MTRRTVRPAIDPGRQPERTRLAWRRTALAMTVVTGLTVRLALGSGPAGVPLAALTLVGWAAVMFLLRPWRGGPAPHAPAPHAPAAVPDRAVEWAPNGTADEVADTAPSVTTTAVPDVAPGRGLPLVTLATVGYAGIGMLLVLRTLG